ncbi:MAG: DUF4923 family protein [Muribaculaceae bacterium]|nr:DUF4923 family protein [Muribaculaceae bacterium]
MRIKAFFVAMLLMCGVTANAQSISDILRGLGGNTSSSSSTTSTIGNLLEGIFTKTDITLKDIVGEYKSAGPAVTFKSENWLQKAGGVAGAAALETKLQPYYEQYGLTGMPLTIDQDGNFTLSIKGVRLSGVVTQGTEKGTFIFNIMVGKTLKLGKFTAYIQKSGKNIELMFDATKLKQLISTVAKFTGGKLVGALGSLLDSYEGACIGFQMNYTGSASTGSGTNSTDTTSSSSGIGSLLNILKGGSSE